jgi:hypothetical protein
MDPKEIIEQSRQQRQQRAVAQARVADAKKGATFAAGQDNNTGQPLVRAIGGAAVPMRSLSNVQAEVGQQGRSDGRGFDVGNRRSPALVDRSRSRPLDIVWAYSDINGIFGVYSPRLGVKTFTDIVPFAAGIHRPAANSNAEDYEVLVLVVDEFVIGQPTHVVKKLNILTGILTTILTIDDQVPGFNNGIHVYFISGTGVSFFSDYTVDFDNISIRGHLYPSYIFPPYPYQEGTVITGDNFTLVGNDVISSGSRDWTGSWIPSEGYTENRLLGFDSRGNFIVRDGSILKGRIAGQDFELLIGFSGLYSFNPQFAFSPLGDLNFLDYPYEPFIIPPEERILNIHRVINLNGILRVGETKRIKMPSVVDFRLLWVDVSPLDLFNTGRGLDP